MKANNELAVNTKKLLGQQALNLTGRLLSMAKKTFVFLLPENSPCSLYRNRPVASMV